MHLKKNAEIQVSHEHVKRTFILVAVYLIRVAAVPASLRGILI